jgi:uncharacterized delta-60 repeat protein
MKRIVKFATSGLVKLSLAVSVGALFAQTALAAPAGDLDTSFAGSGIAYEQPEESNGGEDIISDRFNRTVMVYTSSDALGNPLANLFSLVRYDSSGNYDATFGTGGTMAFPGTPGSLFCNPRVAEDDKGNLLVASCNTTSALFWRFRDDGSLDTSYGVGGLATMPVGSVKFPVIGFTVNGRDAIMSIPAAASAVIGTATDFTLLRLNASGAPDTTLAGTGLARYSMFPGVAGSVSRSTDVKVDYKDRIVMVGRARKSTAEAYEFAAMRVNRFGTLDPSFASGGKTMFPILKGNNLGRRVAFDNLNRIVIAGTACEPINPATGAASCYVGVARLLRNGALDTTLTGGVGVVAFGGSSPYSLPSFCSDSTSGLGVATFKDRILITGACDLTPFTTTGSTSRAYLLRLDSTGNYDATFGITGTGFSLFDFGAPLSGSNAIVIDKNGQNLLAGSASKQGGPDEYYSAAVAARVMQ